MSVLFSSCLFKAKAVVSALELWTVGCLVQAIKFGWRRKRHSRKGVRFCLASGHVEFLGSLLSNPVNTLVCHPAGGRGWDVASRSIAVCNSCSLQDHPGCVFVLLGI